MMLQKCRPRISTHVFSTGQASPARNVQNRSKRVGQARIVIHNLNKLEIFIFLTTNSNKPTVYGRWINN